MGVFAFHGVGGSLLYHSIAGISHTRRIKKTDLLQRPCIRVRESESVRYLVNLPSIWEPTQCT